MCDRVGRIERVGGVSIPVDSLGLAMYQKSSHMCLTLHTSPIQVEVVIYDQLHNHLILLMPVISPTVSVLAYTYMFLSVMNKLFTKADLTNMYIALITTCVKGKCTRVTTISSNIH